MLSVFQGANEYHEEKNFYSASIRDAERAIHDDEKCENSLIRNTALCSTGAVHLHKEGDNKVHKSCLAIRCARKLYLEVEAVLQITS